MGELEVNAVLVGGPEPAGGRHVHVEAHEVVFSVPTADGTGLHVWSRTKLWETWEGGGPLRVYRWVGVPDGPMTAWPTQRPRPGT